MSCVTRIWPSQPAPAPMPMVGILTADADLLRQIGGHAFDDQGERAGLLDGAGVVEEFGGVALHAEAAEPMHRLRRQADVPHDGDVGPDDRRDGGGAALAPFELDRLGAPFLDEPPRTLRALASG